MAGTATAQTLVDGYERLRREALSSDAHQPRALGLGVLVRQGMVTWMKVYSLCAATASPPPPPPGSAQEIRLPPGLLGELARILAGSLMAGKEHS